MPTHGLAKARHGFTLLEVMIATIILAMLTFALHRFISTTLQALTFTTELTEERQEMQALTSLMQSLLNDLPPATPGALTGKAIKLKDLPCDEISWLCRAGAGVMTEAAPGDYRVTLTVQPSEQNTSELELGLRRELVSREDATDADFFQRGSRTNKYNWLPLIRPVAALQIRYWDARLNSPLAQWNDLSARPSFVHVKIWKTTDSLPHDVILPVPSARLQQAQ
ncbi:MAG TPA: prepilin-type N-terminal cleavage/methylation domain-containing protein [Chthoniobacteraceae bacterium]|jgi:prepilin-type N-terminal cleavage/methylation domain-containing protein